MRGMAELDFDFVVIGSGFGGSVARPDEGVVDAEHRVFGYRNLYICDGSVIPVNPGTAPSLTIAAMAERCMSKIPGRVA
jgi:cholesterol oxidase